MQGSVPYDKLEVYEGIYSIGLTPERIEKINELRRVTVDVPQRGVADHILDGVHEWCYVLLVSPDNYMVLFIPGESIIKIISIETQNYMNLVDHWIVADHAFAEMPPIQTMDLIGEAIDDTDDFLLPAIRAQRNGTMSRTNTVVHFHNTLEEFKQFYIRHFREIEPQHRWNNYYPLKNRAIDDDPFCTCWAQFLNWLFNTTYPIAPPLRPANVPIHIQQIARVYERDNNRFYLYYIKDPVTYNNPTSTTYSLHLRVIDSAEPGYNLIDIDRFFYEHPDTCSFDMNVSVNLLPPKEALRPLLARGTHLILTLDECKLAIRHQTQAAESIQDQARLEKLVATRIKKRLVATDKLEINGVTVTQFNFTYVGQIIQDDSAVIDNFELCNLMNNHAPLTSANFNFEVMCDQFYTALVTAIRLGDKTKLHGRIGTVAYELYRYETSAGASLFYVNNIRINKDEIQEVLDHALCFVTQEDYDNYVRDVSLCSLRFHKYLSTGIILNVCDSFIGSSYNKFIFTLPITRDNGKNYLTLNSKTFPIHDTNRLLTLERAENMERVIEVLLNSDVISGVTGSDIRDLVATGKQVYIDTAKAQQEIMDSVIARFNLERIQDPDLLATTEIVKSGYIVHGKLRDYIVTDYNEDTPKVYEYPSGRYICIVEKDRGKYSFAQKFTNRVFTLQSDSILIDQIHTLK